MVTTHDGGHVLLADLLPEGHPKILDGHRFIGCVVEGPAVLLILERCEFAYNKMDTKQFWAIDGNRSYEGGVGIRDCLFQECTFVDVGIAGDRGLIEKFFG